MQLIDEQLLLEEQFRAQVIDEIIGSENVIRKEAALRRHDVLRDKTKKWVIEALSKEGLKPKTLEQMANRASNISVFKKIISKLARSYSAGVQRKADSDADQKAVDELTRVMKVNQKWKKVDRYREAQKNVALQIIPERDTRESSEEAQKFKLKARALAPWQYDVIEDVHDNEIPRVYILTDFIERNLSAMRGIEPGSDGRVDTGPARLPQVIQGDQINQTIADNPADEGFDKRTFIWWSDALHFTTDSKGKVIPGLSPDDLLNPIRILPFVNVTTDQDGEFWAQGGDDLIDGSILLNVLLTDQFGIAYIQGWGQLVITGKNIQSEVSGGPHNAIIVDHESLADPKPEINYISANPPLSDWRASIEQYVALLLTTNNLSPRTISGKLDAVDPASGIAKLIDMSEATDNIEDTQEMFKDKEREYWDIKKRWLDLLADKDALNSEFKEIGTLKSAKLVIKFMRSKPVITEKEKLEMIEMRQRLGINKAIELLQIDNPDLTDAEAELKLKEILEEKLKRQAVLLAQGMEQNAEDKSVPGQQEEKNSENKQQEEIAPRKNKETEINGS